MSRRHRAQKREVLPDPKYKDLTVTKFMNYVMYEGKKAVAENIVYGAFEILADKKKDFEPVQTFHTALENVQPSVEVRSRRVGGATYQVPVEVRPDRRRALAIRWLVNAARKRGENTMTEKLAAELLDASNNRGTAFYTLVTMVCAAVFLGVKAIEYSHKWDQGILVRSLRRKIKISGIRVETRGPGQNKLALVFF